MDATSILVVDDEPGIAMLCKRVLSRAGYSVTTFTEPRAAVQFLKENAVELLLVDIRMPEVDGFELIALAQDLQPDVAVLVMTGYGTVETAIRALQQGVDGLILKPFGQGSDLLESVRNALAGKQQKRDAARTQALRPLFSLSESLLSETGRERLLDLIMNAVLGYLRCQHAGYFQGNPPERLALQVQRGRTFTNPIEDIVAEVDQSAASALVTAGGLEISPLRRHLADLEVGSVMFVPVIRPKFHSVLYAARDPQEAPFQESDFEMFQILARQAVAALENSRLYAEQVEYVRKVEESQKALLQSEKMAAAGRLTASIAHEVNNPLQSVQNCLHLAAREDLSAEKRDEYFDLARTELERLMLTVQRMLDFYRPDTASMENANLGDVLDRVLSLMSKQLSEGKVELKLAIPAQLPAVHVVKSQIQQVFINLILNAQDAMPQGGRLEIRAQPVRSGVELTFQDSGSGISPEQQANIFEPFFSTKSAGTGLGLTVSYNIITAHGGSLEVVQSRGPGACFRLFLPTGGKR
ncbi:MAG TPA: response regulator [Anaerolineales bacterium]|jgi:signal transduction histidine kinase/CheY-like chemotaxis protein